MSAHRTNKFSCNQIAKVYQISKQHAHGLTVKHGLYIVLDPDALFGVLISHQASKLRRKLADPVERLLVRERLDAVENLDRLTAGAALLRKFLNFRTA